MRLRTSTFALALALSGCATPAPVGTTLASASISGTDGSAKGTAALLALGTGQVLRIQLSGLAPGQHGVHLHSVARCDLPDFTSAGPHWNPAGADHGSLNPRGPHAGDLGNVRADADGRVDESLTLPAGGRGTGHRRRVVGHRARGAGRSANRPWRRQWRADRVRCPASCGLDPLRGKLNLSRATSGRGAGSERSEARDDRRPPKLSHGPPISRARFRWVRSVIHAGSET